MTYLLCDKNHFSNSCNVSSDVRLHNESDVLTVLASQPYNETGQASVQLILSLWMIVLLLVLGLCLWCLVFSV